MAMQTSSKLRKATAWMLLAGAVLASEGCRKQPADRSREVEASAAFRAAWEKRQSGDDAGYRAGLADVMARWPDSRAAARAKERQKEGGGSGVLAQLALGGMAAAMAVPAMMKFRANAEAAGDAPPPPEETPAPAKRRAKRRR